MWHTANAAPMRRNPITTYVGTETPAARVSARYRLRDDRSSRPSGLVSTHRAHTPLATLVAITSATNATSVSGAHDGLTCGGSAMAALSVTASTVSGRSARGPPGRSPSLRVRYVRHP